MPGAQGCTPTPEDGLLPSGPKGTGTVGARLRSFFVWQTRWLVCEPVTMTSRHTAPDSLLANRCAMAASVEVVSATGFDAHAAISAVVPRTTNSLDRTVIGESLELKKVSETLIALSCGLELPHGRLYSQDISCSRAIPRREREMRDTPQPGLDWKRRCSRPCPLLQRGTAVILLLGAAVVAAQEQPRTAPPTPRDGTIDEIIVTGKSLLRLEHEALRAEEAFYKAFNAVNTDHQFDVRCEDRTRANSHFGDRVCVAAFVANLEADDTRAFLQGLPQPPTYALMAEKTKQLRQKLLDAARQSPAVGAALIEAANARTAYEKENARRCADRVYFCRRN